jgi:hypothetical protein
MSLFVIVGKNEPIFEADFSTSSTSTGASPNKVRLGICKPDIEAIMLFHIS